MLQGMTALMYAANANAEASVEYLLSINVNVNKQLPSVNT
jgi:ankyrin repeat protein